MQLTVTAMMEPIATQFVQYTNDAVEVWYADGARLQLSACGGAFVHHQAPAQGQHPLHGGNSVQQRSLFVTSTFKDKVIEALDFRNRFAERPYICGQLLQTGSVLKLHDDIFEIGWPSKLSDDHVCMMPDGSVKMVSLDGYGSLCLAPCLQQFSVQYLAKVGQTRSRDKGEGQSSTLTTDAKQLPAMSRTSPPDSKPDQSQDSTGSSSQSESGTAEAILAGGRWDYVWATQHHSIHNCPKHWSQPLDLLRNYVKANRGKLPTGGNTAKPKLSKPVAKLNLKNCSFSGVPQTLPLNCRAVHLHKWKSEVLPEKSQAGQPSEFAYLLGRLKIICIHGIIYRLMWTNPRGVEIYPGDGSVLRSTGIAAHYYTHFVCTGEQIEERMYSIQCLPPHVPGAKYSIAKLIERGARFLQLLQEEHTQLLVTEDSCCWKSGVSPQRLVRPLPTVLLEECTVDGVGRFTAYSSGHVRVAFSDRVCLDVQADFSHRLEGCRQHSDIGQTEDDHSLCQAKPRPLGQPSDLLQSTCRLLLPNGHYQTVLIADPGDFHKYVQAVLEWVSWVNTMPSERYDFYKDTIHDQDKRSSIASELAKINCFNYIIEHTVLPQFGGLKVSEPAAAVPDILHSTLTTQPPDLGYYGNLTPVTMATLSTTEFSTIRQHTSFPSQYTGGWDTSSNSVDSAGYNMVQEALSKTARHLQNLDKFLESNGEVRPVRDS